MNHLKFSLVGVLLMLTILMTLTSCMSNNKSENELEIPKCPDCNVILYLIDTLRADHVGAYGYHRNTTPNIDKLAEEGFLFENMIAHSSWTRPATGSILTGLYPKNHGAVSKNTSLDDEIVLISEVLQENGYKTYAIVTNLNVGHQVGFNQGYDNFSSMWNSKKFPNGVKSSMVNVIVENALEELSSQDKGFIYIHSLDPHIPYTPLERHFSKNSSIKFDYPFMTNWELLKLSKEDQEEVLSMMVDSYDDEIRWNDKSIGELISILKEKRMYNNTIIIILSDHGEEFLDHGALLHGNTLYEEQIKVPLIIKVPGLDPKRFSKQVNQIDIFPSILDLLGISYHYQVDGVSVLNPLFERRHSFSELESSHEHNFAVTGIGEKLLFHPEVASLEPEFWVQRKVVIDFRGNEINLSIASFHVNRSLSVFVNGIKRKDINISPESELIKFKVSLFRPFFNIEKNQMNRIVLKSDSCQRPIALGISDDLRCFSFHIDLGTDQELIQPRDAIIYPERRTEYYKIDKDPSEKVNLISSRSDQQNIKRLMDEIKEYNLTRRNNQIPMTNYSEEYIQALKALGYIQ